MTARTEYALQDLTDPCPDEAVATKAEASAPIRTMRNLIARTDDRTTQRLAAGSFLEGPLSQKSRKATCTTASSTATSENLVRLLREGLGCSSASRSPGFSISRLQVGRSDLVRRRTHALPASSKPLETTGERGANGAPSVRRVAPRTDLSNARS